MEKIGVVNYSSSQEKSTRSKLTKMLRKSPIPESQILENLGLFLSSKNLSRILFMDKIYRMIVDVPGVVFDFGTRWGQNMALFSAMRGIYEPFNRHRKVVGFDTFEGFPNVADQDGSSELMKAGNVSVTEGYYEYLSEVMECHEEDNPLSHLKKHEIVKGDVVSEITKYLDANPETIVSLAYFDFDIYEPTKKCLEAISNRIVKGSVLAFDELNDSDSPGETLALMECIGLNNVKLKRYRYVSRSSYFVVGE